MQLILLGMHRAGTSALAGVMDHLGAYLGSEEEFNIPDIWNPTGYWERKDVWGLNEEILRELGRTWYSVADLNFNDLDPLLIQDYESRAKIIIQKLDKKGLWAIKDPRLCILFPIWRKALNNAIIVFIHRHPFEIALSLKNRDSFPISFSVALWEAYIVSFLAQTTGFRRIMVSHAELMRNPAKVASNLYESLKKHGASTLREPSVEDLKKIIDINLYRSKVSKSGLDIELNSSQNSILRQLGKGDFPNITEPGALTNESVRGLKLYGPIRQECDEVHLRHKEFVQKCQTESKNLHKEIASLRHHIALDKNTIKDLLGNNNKVKKEIESCQSELSRVEKDCECVHGENKKLENDNRIIHAENVRLQKDNDAIHSENKRLEDDNREIHAENIRLQKG